MPSNNTTNNTAAGVLNQGNSGTTTGEGEDSGKINEQEDGPVENKYNDLTRYWDPLEEKFVMSSDTPVVRIFISREIVKDTAEGEEGEGGEGEVQELEDAVKESYDMSMVYKEQGITNDNTSVVKLNGEQVLAMNAVDKIDLKNIPK